MSAKRPIKIAIAGNPNSGKSTLFNALTGGRVAVGNWPGVTVEKHVGRARYQGHEVVVVDLPGTYALDAWTLDERIAREFLLTEKPDGVVAVVDAANLERNLYLVVQLLELGARVVLALNMMDLARARGLEIDTARLEQALGVKVVPMVARQGAGVDELRRAIHDLGRENRPLRPLRIDYGEEIERGLERVVRALPAELPPAEKRWHALKLLEGEPPVSGELANAAAVAQLVRAELSRRHRHDAQSAIVERRYGFIRGVLRECVRPRPGIGGALFLSEILDAVVLNRVLGIPLFFLMMAATFGTVFYLGTPGVQLLEKLLEALNAGAGAGLNLLRAPEWLVSLLTAGVLEGVGAVLKFLPTIFLLYLILALLEDSGYMARAAFLMDRFMHALGLHGKSFVPLIMGFGCNVPAVLAVRTLESRKDRILTVLAVPFISCAARLPVYLLFAGTFFPRLRGLVVFSLYILGIVLGVLSARLFRRTLFPGAEAPLIMELPPYHTPTLRTVLRPAGLRTLMFLRRAGVVIAPAAVVIWVLGRLPWGVGYASAESVLGRIGGVFAPLLKPAGFGYWWAAVGLLAGVVAKELLVSTLASIHSTTPGGLTAALLTHFTPLSAYAFMVMALLYFPCVATFAAIRRELGWSWAGFTAGYTVSLSWLTATAIYQLGRVL